MSTDAATTPSSPTSGVEPKPASPHARARHPLLPAPGELTITDTPASSRLVDVMGGALRREIRVHEHGFIALVDAMPRLVPEGQTADAAIVQAARVSYGEGTKKVNEDRGLIRYLLRHRHTTPFEMLEFKFHVAMPVFVARQWIRHRTANVNEYSARYSIVPDRFYRPAPDAVRKQSVSNRQGGEEPLDLGDPAQARTAEQFLSLLSDAEGLYARYAALLEEGVTRELARSVLPVSVYTEWYWKCDLHNILRFLSLRLDSHAQKEIRDYARAMYALLESIVPITMEAFRDYELDAIRLTGPEVEALRTGRALASENARERAEWEQKRGRIGLAPLE
ncbi:MAG: FAD-dependent thymidylate synthase [Phycisphaerales bacterium]|jgi:thymidylate synthase (FAD)|nr:FAD-dependent thymidylate synthase [Phycisphaerales bacterium]